MKAQNLLIAFVTLLMVSYGSIAFGDDDTAASTTATTQASAAVADMAMSEVTVNINVADAKTLATSLIGVGLSRAQAIVDYRENYGPFYSAEELSAVKGIGSATVAKNANRIVVE